MLIIIDSRIPQTNKFHTAATPFGPVNYEEIDADQQSIIVLHREAGQNPKSLAYAARASAGTRVIGVIRDSNVNQTFTPSNYIEFTSGRPTTFFETIGTGYVQQDPPYCPELRQTLLAAAAEETGSLLILDKLPASNIRSWWQSHQVSLISTETQPEAALCRELELCYAVLALPAAAKLTALLPDILALLPAERHCGCDQLMATARKFGKLTSDWFENL